jgi:antimicrobial peptide system SdpB family protein
MRIKFLTNQTIIYPWTNIYGVSRSIIASATFLTLLVNPIDILIKPTGIDISEIATTSELQKTSLFYILSGDLLSIAKIISMIVLFLVIIGYKPKFTGVFHWYVTFSFSNSVVLVNGGDQIAAILTLLLIPVTLFDNRTWHWEPWNVDKESIKLKMKSIISYSSIVVIRIQMSIIYFMAGVSKLAVDEWADGTAIYYWFNHSSIGLVDWQYKILEPILVNSFTIMTLTWGAILIEILLACAIFMNSNWKKFMYAFGIMFHLSIALFMGLISFSMIMIAGLTIYLLPIDKFMNFSKHEKFHLKLA